MIGHKRLTFLDYLLFEKMIVREQMIAYQTMLDLELKEFLQETIMDRETVDKAWDEFCKIKGKGYVI